MPTPRPHQLTGALFLAERKAALLADDPRVGKTGAAVLACDYVLARRVLVITTASGRPNWERDFREWSYPRSVQTIYATWTRISAAADVVIVGWPALRRGKQLDDMVSQPWDVVIPDECHNAKNFDAARTIALFRDIHSAHPGAYWWALSGTPAPSGAHELFPLLSTLAPERLAGVETFERFVSRYSDIAIKILSNVPDFVYLRMIADKNGEALRANAAEGWPDVSKLSDFKKRYGFFNGSIRKNVFEFNARFSPSKAKHALVFTGSKNVDDLRRRLNGFWLRRTQQDVGIGEPIYSTFLVHAGRLPAELRDIPHADEILAAAEAGDTRTLDMHLGTIRRVTGVLVARLVVDAITEELDSGLDRIVLMAWHTEVVDLLARGLSRFGVVTLDGRSTPAERKRAEDDFRAGHARVFVGQILAAGENIDLSASCNLMFVELSFVPKDMKQASLRITNLTQTRQCLVRVCALEGSIYEALSRIVVRKVATLRQLTEK